MQRAPHDARTSGSPLTSFVACVATRLLGKPPCRRAGPERGLVDKGLEDRGLEEELRVLLLAVCVVAEEVAAELQAAGAKQDALHSSFPGAEESMVPRREVMMAAAG